MLSRKIFHSKTCVQTGEPTSRMTSPALGRSQRNVLSVSNSCCPYDLVVILHGEALGGTERHTIDMINHLVALGWRLAYVQAGIDLCALGLATVSGTLRVVPTSLPMRNLSRAETRAWSRLLKTLPAARVLEPVCRTQ